MKHRLIAFVLSVFVLTASPTFSADHLYGTASPWGQMVDPDGDCSFTVSRDAISIGFSGAAHGLDAEKGRMNAPRVIRSMKGDFAAQVTVAGNLPLPDDKNVTAYVSGGLLLMLDDQNYIRLERASFTRRGTVHHYTNFEQRINAKRTRMGLFRDYPLANDLPVELRLEVKSGEVRALARIGGQPWHEMGTAQVDKDPAFTIGVTGVNTSQQPVDVTFRDVKYQSDPIAVECESSSELELSHAAGTVALPRSNSSRFAKLMAGVMEIQKRSKGIAKISAEDREQLIDDAVTLIQQGDPAASLRFGPTVVRELSRAYLAADDPKHAIAVYDRFIPAIKDLDDENVDRTVKQLDSDVERLKFRIQMIGKPLDLEGETIDGDVFDWTSYDNKVTLVDFWASWCGPCRREIPNVLEQYKKYHDRGFEVVGICLDTDRDKAASYVAEAEIPWPSLFEEDAGWQHPMATRYKVTAIPTALLLDSEGNVVSLSARGEELSRRLRDLLGPITTHQQDDTSSGSATLESAPPPTASAEQD